MAHSIIRIATMFGIGFLVCTSGVEAQTLKEGQRLTTSICKANCQYYGAPGNCQNVPDRISDGKAINSQSIVADGSFAGKTTISVNGKLLARADTCNRNSELRIKITPIDGSGAILESVSSQCGPSMLTATGIQKTINLNRQTSGNIEFTLINGDWCSSVENLVFTTN